MKTITASQIRKSVKENYCKFFAVTKMKNQGLSTNYCLSNCFGDDFTFLIEKLSILGIKAECIGNKNSLLVYGNI